MSTNQCTVPPEGWGCTREAGHDGPCAAWPVGREVFRRAVARELMTVANEPEYRHIQSPEQAALVAADRIMAAPEFAALIRVPE